MLQLQIELIGINICTTHVRVHLSHVDWKVFDPSVHEYSDIVLTSSLILTKMRLSWGKC